MMLRTVGFAYDLAGRITTQTLPDSRQIGYTYDGNGNVTSITPPGKLAHAFIYTPVDLEADYNPPDIGITPRDTQYTYNLDRQLTLGGLKGAIPVFWMHEHHECDRQDLGHHSG